MSSGLLGRWRLLAEAVDVRMSVFLTASALSFAGALFEGASAGLLVPTLEGALRRDFSFLAKMPLGAELQGLLPESVVASDAKLFAFLICAIFVLVLARLLASYVAAMLSIRELWTLVRKLQEVCLSRYLSFGKRFFDKNNAGHLRNMLVSHPFRLVLGLHSAQAAIYWSCSLVAYCALMVWISWKLAVAVAFLFPILYLSLNGIVARIKRTSMEHAKVNKRVNEHSFNLLASMPLVKVANMEQAELAEFARLSKESADLEWSQARKSHLIHPLQELILTVTVLLLVALAALTITDAGSKGISGFLVFFYLLKRSATTFNDLNKLRGQLGAVSGVVEEVADILDDANKPFVPDGPLTFTGLVDEIRFDDLTFAYEPGIPVLRGLSCVFRKGETTAIVGKTGSGKTTLVNLLLRHYQVPEGALLLDGTDIREFELASVRQHIAYVSQDPILFNDTIRANLTYGLGDVSEARLQEVVDQAHLRDLISRHPDGLESVIGDRGIMVSGGEKQRIAIARALLKRAEILVLDEATSSLDTRTERLVQEAIDACLQGRTALVIAHRLSTIKKADRIVLLEDGQLVESGTLAELLAAQGRFYGYWQAQSFETPPAAAESAPEARDEPQVERTST